MSYTNSTANLKLPQWEDNDYPSWLTDVNQAFSNIDTNTGEQKASIETALNTASEAHTLATEASNNVTSLSGEVNSVKSDVSEIRELATTATTTANSAMDVAEIAQDSAEQVANKTANIESDSTKISHTVNGAVSGYTEYGQGFTSLCSSNGTSKLDFDDSGNIVSRDNQNAIVFNSNDILSRISALEAGGGGSSNYTIKTITPTGAGDITLVQMGKLCILSLWNVSGVLANETVCTLPISSAIKTAGCGSNSSGTPFCMFYISKNSNIVKCNKELTNGVFASTVTITFVAL